MSIESSSGQVIQNDARFLFVSCQQGAEGALKEELKREHPALRLAYSRPGFITLKHGAAEDSFEKTGGLAPDFELKSVFARSYGLSVGKGTAEQVMVFVREKFQQTGEKFRLHVFERDFYAPAEEPQGWVAGVCAARAKAEVIAAAGSNYSKYFYESTEAKEGDLVIDVIVVESDVSAPLWYGWHEQIATHAPWPGGNPEIVLPVESPSRAYLKLREAQSLYSIPLKKDQKALEIGSSPGGACWALLEQGLYVLGVDFGEMKKPVLGHPHFAHFKCSADEVTIEDLDPVMSSPDWLLMDIHAEPVIALSVLRRFLQKLERPPLGLILTLKIPRWELAKDLPQYERSLRSMGMAKIRMKQLPSNRQEISVFALTRVGADRHLSKKE